jgi:hypothetical protein
MESKMKLKIVLEVLPPQEHQADFLERICENWAPISVKVPN